MMSKASQFSVLFLVVFCHIYYCYGKPKTDLYQLPQNNIVTFIENLGFPISKLKDPLTTVKTLALMSNYWQVLKDNYVLGLLNFIGNMTDNNCYRDLGYSIHGLLSGKEWAIRMLDAYGKPESGLLEGNIKWLGDYHECTTIYVSPETHEGLSGFHGQYCSLSLSVHLSNREVPILYGICIPESCNLAKLGQDINTLFNTLSKFLKLLPFLERLQSPVTVNEATCQPVAKKLTSEASFMLVVLCFLILLAIIGSSITAYEYFTRGDTTDQIPWDHNKEMEIFKKGKWMNVKSFFKCFCCFENTQRLFFIGDSEQVLCLYGIRVLSFCWILYAHTFGYIFLTIGNALEAMELSDHWSYELVFNGYYSVDSFIFLSGFLVGHLSFRQFSRTGGKMSWFNFYFHRYIRLTPVYMLVLGISATLVYYLTNGPFAETTAVMPVCSEYWWWNLLYINNFFNDWCEGWSFYLALDMQFYLVSPLFLITLWRCPKIGYFFVALFIFITFIINFVLTYKYNLITGLTSAFTPNVDMKIFQTRYDQQYNLIYDKPYTRISPYIVGIALSYYMFQRNKQNKNERLSGFTLCFGWALATFVSLFGLFHLYRRKEDVLVNSFHNALYHINYSFCLGWVVFVCITKQAGIVNSILSWKVFVPLSRLTYCGYLIQHFVSFPSLMGRARAFHFSEQILVLTYLGLLVEVYFCAFVAHLLLEAPFIQLEKFVKSYLRTQNKPLLSSKLT